MTDGRERWLATPAEMHDQFGVLIHGCMCVARRQALSTIPKHYHAVIETPRPNRSQAMGWLHTTYTIQLNRWRRRSGHLLQGLSRARRHRRQPAHQMLTIRARSQVASLIHQI